MGENCCCNAVSTWAANQGTLEDCLRQWLISLPSEILRVKGIARISDTEKAYFNRTDDPFESPRIIRPDAEAGMEPAVVFIGPGLSEKFLRSSFQMEDQRREFKLSPESRNGYKCPTF